jgi:hypothetical protein
LYEKNQQKEKDPLPFEASKYLATMFWNQETKNYQMVLFPDWK